MSNVLVCQEIEAYNLNHPLLLVPECYFAQDTELRVLKLETCFSQSVPFFGCKSLPQLMVTGLS